MRTRSLHKELIGGSPNERVCDLTLGAMFKTQNALPKGLPEGVTQVGYLKVATAMKAFRHLKPKTVQLQVVWPARTNPV